MKKFIDKKSGKIISLLTIDEAKKVLKMYINYCLQKEQVSKSRLNLVEYLGDFISYSDNKEISKFYDVLVKEKEGFEFSKSDAKAYDSLISFFELYNNIDKGEFELQVVSDYITNIVKVKNSINEKIVSGNELNFEERLINIFFSKNFDVSILATRACNKWEEKLKNQIEQNENGIDISLQEEIAYQDLLELSNPSDSLEELVADTTITSALDQEDMTKPENEESSEESNFNEIAEESTKDFIVEKTPEIITDEVVSDTENEEVAPVEESNTDNNDEIIDGPIIVNQVNEDDEHEKPKNTNTSEETKSEGVNPESIREITEDVSLRDSADFFSGALDGFTGTMNTNEQENNN